MEQAIVGVIRPNARITDTDGHLGHLLEHLFLNYHRLRKNGFSKASFVSPIVYYNGFVNEMWEMEYFVTPANQALPVLEQYCKTATTINCSKQVFINEKRVLLQELSECRTQKPSLDELFYRAAITPTLKSRWYDDTQVKELQYDQLLTVAEALIKDHHPFALTKDRFLVKPKIDIKRKSIQSFKGKTLVLTHPSLNRGIVASSYFLPLKIPDRLKPAFRIFLAGLQDDYFGILTDLFRRHWHCYSYDCYYDPYCQSLVIDWTTDQHRDRLVAQGIQTLINSNRLTTHIQKNTRHLAEIVSIADNLAWGNATVNTLRQLDLHILGRFDPLTRDDLDSVSPEDLLAIHQLLMQHWSTVRRVKRIWGEQQ